MAEGQLTPFVNGHQFDFGQITVKVTLPSGVQKVYTEWKEIKYGFKRENKKSRGTSPFARRRTRGTIDFQASGTMYRSGPGGFDELIHDLGPGWAEAELEITVVYGNDGDDLKTDTLTRVQIMEAESGGSEGADDLEIPLTLDPMAILFDGEPPLAGMVV